MTAQIIPFLDLQRSRTEQSLQAARAVLRPAEDQDEATLREACHVMETWGTTRDGLVARTYRLGLTRPPVAKPPAPISKAHLAFQIAGGALTAAIVLAIIWDAPARIAATVLQAQETSAW